jgi:uncharacterized membrane protein
MTIPPGWNYTLLHASPVLLESDGGFDWSLVEINVPQNATPSEYIVTVRTTNLDSSYVTDKNITIVVTA